MTLLADLPPEILAQIFSYLPAAHIGQCSLTSRLFYTVIANSIELQYIIHLHLAHLESNPCSRPLTYGDKLGAIKAREHAWTYLKPDFSKRAEVPFEPGSVYDLSGDVYILGDSNRTKLHCLKLPSAENDPVEWRALASREGRQIVDFAINLYEHDMIVLVTAPHRTSFFQPQHVSAPIELSLHKFSTNEPHPLAKQHIIQLVSADQQWGPPAINMEIVGDYLTIIASFWRVVRSRCLVTVYEWKTGRTALRIEGRPNSYSGVIYLTSTLILLPNIVTSSLEVWRIPTSEDEPAPKVPVVKLQLPALAEGYFYAFISCRAEPNPYKTKPGTGTETETWYSDKPFHPRPDDSVILFHIRIISANNEPNDRSELHTLFVHRKTIINIVENVEREAKERKHKEEEEERQRQKRVEEGEEEEDDFESWIRKNFSSGDWGVINQNPSISSVLDGMTTTSQGQNGGASTATSTSSSANGMTHAPSSTQTPVSITTPNAALDASASQETEFPPLASPLPNPLPLPQRHRTFIQQLFRQIRSRHSTYSSSSITPVPPVTVLAWDQWSVPSTTNPRIGSTRTETGTGFGPGLGVFMINSGSEPGRSEPSRWITTSCGERFVLLVPFSPPTNVDLSGVNGRAKTKTKEEVDLKDPNFPRIVGGDEGLAPEGLEEFKEMGRRSVRARMGLGLDSDSDSDSEESCSSDDEDYDMDFEEDKDEDDVEYDVVFGADGTVEVVDQDKRQGQGQQPLEEEDRHILPARVMVFDFNPLRVWELEKELEREREEKRKGKGKAVVVLKPNEKYAFKAKAREDEEKLESNSRGKGKEREQAPSPEAEEETRERPLTPAQRWERSYDDGEDGAVFTGDSTRYPDIHESNSVSRHAEVLPPLHTRLAVVLEENPDVIDNDGMDADADDDPFFLNHQHPADADAAANTSDQAHDDNGNDSDNNLVTFQVDDDEDDDEGPFFVQLGLGQPTVRERDFHRESGSPFVDRVTSCLPCVITMGVTASLSLSNKVKTKGKGKRASGAESSDAGLSTAANAGGEDEEPFPILPTLQGSHGLLADDERVLGIGSGRMGAIDKVEIVRFG
ncbi:hypothetical protein VKT23_017904 [Stygiomarasmius scandens]|uniref:F-box domain-containing protein n=1 Tax=Marasmiellus scandens TaxID=2682957 RepID=A0ABR1ITH5_9AGAR